VRRVRLHIPLPKRVCRVRRQFETYAGPANAARQACVVLPQVIEAQVLGTIGEVFAEHGIARSRDAAVATARRDGSSGSSASLFCRVRRFEETMRRAPPKPYASCMALAIPPPSESRKIRHGEAEVAFLPSFSEINVVQARYATRAQCTSEAKGERI